MAAFKGRLASTHGQNSSRAQEVKGNTVISAAGTGKRGRPLGDVAGHSQGPTLVLDKLCNRDTLRAASVADKDLVRGQPTGGIRN